MNSAAVIKLIEADSWYKAAQKGSHVQFEHPSKPGRITVPRPKRDVPVGTLHSIKKQAGLV